jgi:hypothetical protein
MNPSPFPYGLETSRDLHTIIIVRDSGQPFGFCFPDIHVARHILPGSSL